MSEIRLDADLLLAQARSSDHAARAIGTARDAAASMNLSGGAFGLICAFLVPMASSVTLAAEGAMKAAEAMLERDSNALRATADDFVDYEDDLSQELRAIARTLE